MAKSTKYSKIITLIDKALSQEKEYPDAAAAERYRSLPRAETPDTLNDVLKELAKKKESAYTEEIILYFYDSTTDHYPLRDGEYFYIDINESVSGNILTVPYPIKIIVSYIAPGSYTESNQRDGYWSLIPNGSVSKNDIYAVSTDRIYNVDGWNDGDEMRVTAVVYPVDIKYDITPVAISTLTLNLDDTIDLTSASSIDIRRGDIIKLSSCSPADYDGLYHVIHKSGTSVSLKPYDASPAGVFVSGSIGYDPSDLIVDIDDGFIRLLILEMKKKAFSRENKAMDSFEYIELVNERRPEWIGDKGRVNAIGTANYGGACFGRKR